MTYHQIGIAPETAQFIETRKFQLDEIARIFRIPPHLIGDLEHATFSNIEHQSIEFVKYTLTPWISRIESSLEKALISPEEYGTVKIKFNLDGLLRGSYKERMDGYAVGLTNGIYSVNDVRELEDLNLLTEEQGGNYHFVNGSYTKLSDIGAAYGESEEEIRVEK